MKPSLEGLEGRFLLYASSGNRFVHGTRITWSIVPDGANLYGVSSNLNASLNAKIGAGNWLNAVQDAFATWQAAANINFVQVTDDGSPGNWGSFQQGSPNVGDIRIGGFNQDANTLGFSILPPPSNGASSAGDIVLNSSQAWRLGSSIDLQTTLIHEIGHSLGLDHSTVTTAAMYPYYNGVQQDLATDDINGIRSIWSARQDDFLTQANQNYTWTAAANLNPYISSSNNWVTLNALNVTSPSKSYWMKVTTPSNASSTLTAVVQAANLSELSPKVQIYNASLQGLAQASASSTAYGATISTSISNAAPNTTYYIRVSAASAGSNGSGNYALLVNMGPNTLPTLSPPNTVVLKQADQGGGSSGQTTSPWLAGLMDPGKGTENLGSNNNGLINVMGTMLRGDYFTLGPVAKTTSTAKVDTPVALIPIELPTGPVISLSKSTRRDSTIVQISQAHPVGPA